MSDTPKAAVEASQEAASQRTITIALVLGAVAMTALIRLVPYDYRILNFVPLGAMALFAGARWGFRASLVLSLAAMVITDLCLWQIHGRSELYTPWFVALFGNWTQMALYAITGGASVYIGLAAYAYFGQRGVGQSESPSRIATVTVGSGLFFFLFTNFVSWLLQMNPYGYSIQGLINCYVAAVPFYRGTFVSDLVFSGMLFSAHAMLIRAFSPSAAMRKAIALEVRS